MGNNTVCLGPSGNKQVGHYFMSLSTGKLLHQQYWIEIRMPAEAIDQVSQWGIRDKMPRALNFGNQIGIEYPYYDDNKNDDHDSMYAPDEDEHLSHGASES
jgi:hypothetical protein